jgi:hypothetical protein
LLALEQFRQFDRVDAGYRDMRANPIHHQSAQQEPEPAPEVAELACLA